MNLRVRPQELQIGDQFYLGGHTYEVVGKPEQGEYAIWRIPVARLTPKTVAFEYDDYIVVSRPDS